MSTAIEFNNVSKQYRLGVVSTRTLSNDLHRWWVMNVLRKEDPYLKIGEENDRATKGDSEYVWALKDIDFKVEEGDVVGIIGKNGAGKSTLLKLLSKVTTPTTGIIRARGRIASLLEVGTGFHPELTGRENIYMNAAILGMSKQEINSKLDEIVDFSGCERYIDTPVKRYSSGMIVRLGFAVAAHLDPDILVVDEVLAVGDAEFQKKAIGKMQDISRGDGRTVLFVSHNMGAVRNLCKSGVLLEKGRLKYAGEINEVVNYYLDNRVVNKENKVIIRKEAELNSIVPVGFLSVEMENETMLLSIEDSLSFVFHIKANKNVEGCRINATITTLDGIAVGSVSNDTLFEIKSGEKKCVRLVLYDHKLAVGKYLISFSVGIGNYKTGQVDFDYIGNAFEFEIDSQKEDGGNVYFAQWDKCWGSIMFPYKVEILS